MFGKVMSISDTLMWRYFELLSFRPLAEIEGLRRGIADGRNPRDVKFELGRELVARFHDTGAAERAQREFIARVSEKAVPTDLVAKDSPGRGHGNAHRQRAEGGRLGRQLIRGEPESR